jgi:hypothetical protein
MKKTIAVLSLLLLSIYCKATCIIIIIRNDTIFVASDSRSTIFFKNEFGKKDSLFKSICKINHIGSVYFTMAGHGDNLLPSIALKAFENSKNLGESWHLFLAMAKDALEKNFEYMRINDSKLFLRYKQSGNACQFSVFGFRGNHPYLSTASFHIISNSNTSVKITTSQDSKPAVILGFKDHLNKLSAPLPINKKGLSYYESDIINYEMSFHKSYIAPPIDLLQLTSQHAIWIQKKSSCY